MIKVEAIYRYPIKSCAGISLDEAQISHRGILLDRLLMVVDERGIFVTQRNGNTYGNIGIRSMCLIAPKVQMKHPYILVAAPDMTDLLLDPFQGDTPISARIWGDIVEAVEVNRYVSEWFTTYLSRERPGRCRLVRMRAGYRRKVSRGEAVTGFADAYPFLVASCESLSELNQRMGGLPVGMDRFRPNIVISGCDRPHAEDSMNRIRIGGVEFVGRDLCDRCPVPGIDQMTGKKDGRPLTTLARYRKTRPESDKVQFGRNFIHCGNGHIRVGDEVAVL